MNQEKGNIMNKIICTLIIALSITTAFAAEQYDRLNPNQGAGIVLTGDASLTLTFLDSTGKATNFSSIFPSGYNLFGYYLMDSKNNMTSWTALDLSNVVDGQLTLGDFSAGDRIAFWAANETGEYMDSMHRDPEKGNSRDSAYVNNNGQNNVTITMGGINANGWGAVDFGAVNDKTNYIFQITEGKASGQPLPGVVAVIALGGAALFARRKMKK